MVSNVNNAGQGRYFDRLYRNITASRLIKEHQQALMEPGQKPLTASMLAAAKPQEQKQMLGERLFPLIQRINPNLGGKITGMMLEMDNSELLHLLESNESLQAQVQQAVMVLQDQEALTASISDAQSEEQKQILGERLFPLIQRITPSLAGKITGMLLEMDNSEFLQLLESNESLEAKVKEAVAVLQAD